MSEPIVRSSGTPVVTRLKDAIYLIDFRHVDMFRTEALMKVRNQIDAEVPAGSTIGTIMDWRGMNNYSYHPARFSSNPWQHEVIRSAWLVNQVDYHISVQSVDYMEVPYPVSVFLTQDEAMAWLEQMPGAPKIAPPE